MTEKSQPIRVEEMIELRNAHVEREKELCKAWENMPGGLEYFERPIEDFSYIALLGLIRMMVEDAKGRALWGIGRKK